MTTEQERAERLAGLTERRRTPPSDPPAAAPTPATGGGSGRRRSPAATAKIVTVGASATAMLGLMAGYGMADRAAADAPTFLAAPATPVPATIPLAPPPSTSPATTPPPQVVVVVIDGATGQQISGTIQAGEPLDVRLPQAETSVSQNPESMSVVSDAPAPPSTPTPVAVPVAVDLAVPKPPPPPARQTQTAPAPAPQTQPQPQAESGGS